MFPSTSVSSFVFRPHTDEESIWAAVVNDDEYRLAPLTAEDPVIDVGAHTGAFVFKAVQMGARTIRAFEVSADNFAMLEMHVEAIYASHQYDHMNVLIEQAAVVRSDERSDEQVFFSGFVEWPEPGAAEVIYANTGCGTIFGDAYPEVATVCFDNILDEFPHVRLVKMDVEGAEWPILLTSKELGRVQEIVGEFHLAPRGFDAQALGLPQPSLEVLCEVLSKAGFETRCYGRAEDCEDGQLTKNTAGYFRAVRGDYVVPSSFTRDLTPDRVLLRKATP